MNGEKRCVAFSNCQFFLSLLLIIYNVLSGGGACGAIAPVPIFKGGAPLQFLSHLFFVNFVYIL